MKTPIHCPSCNGPLLSIPIKLTNGSEIWKKTCYQKIDHVFMCMTRIGNDDELSSVDIVLDRGSNVRVHWLLNERKIFVYKGTELKVPKDYLSIPWFTPDFSSYKFLVGKIKTYITFL